MKSIFLLFCALQSVTLGLGQNPLGAVGQVVGDVGRDVGEITLNVLNIGDWIPLKLFNEDANLNFSQLAEKYGYETETHDVTTEDGYILSLFRITHGPNCTRRKYKSPVLAMHGCFDSADAFLLPGPGKGFGHILSDYCYDTWFGNVRGNKYGLRHVNKTLEAQAQSGRGEFWNFSYDEMGYYDLKATVDYVLNATQVEKLLYIGHSLGSTIFWVLASTRPEYMDKFSLSVALAPLAYFHDVNTTQFVIFGPGGTLVGTLMGLLGNFEVFRPTPGFDVVKELIGQLFPELGIVAVPVILGGDPKEIGPDTIQVASGHFPQPSSARFFVHLSQGVFVDKFRKFDFGTARNMEKYGTADPPEYDLTKIKTPVALFDSQGDPISDLRDVAKLKAQLPNIVEHKEYGQDWGHRHYVLANNLKYKLFPYVNLQLLRYGLH